MTTFKTLDSLEHYLAKQLQKGCLDGVEVLQQSTPIDAQRLVETVRASDVKKMSKNTLVCQILIGGESRYGIRKEQDTLKPVNYAKYVEISQHFVRNSLTSITQAIVTKF